MRQPGSFWDGSRAAVMGLDVEYLMLSQRPLKSAPLCSIEAAAPDASLNSMMAVLFCIQVKVNITLHENI